MTCVEVTTIYNGRQITDRSDSITNNIPQWFEWTTVIQIKGKDGKRQTT